MKKTSIMGLLLVLVLVTSCFAGGTFAKYTSVATGSDEANVALWSVKVNDSQIAHATPQTFTFNLFKTVNDTAGAAEADVHKQSNDDNIIIAPGTSGQFAIDIKNLSEVNAEYKIEFTETANTIPLQFSLDGTKWYDTVAEINIAFTNIAMRTGTASHTVQWRWAFNDTDTAVTNSTAATDDAHVNQTNTTDTKLGIDAQTTIPTVTITATLTIEQVD